ncbi:VOC family protein [Staphylococcus caeli]|uniref:VOC family protein n=1 Tax=Staphylococcus caeli TaxID=2201815 RepID=UPI003F57664E
MFHNQGAHFVNGITLNVRDKATMKHFYQDILGLNIVNESYSVIQYEIGNLNHFLTLKEVQSGRVPLTSEVGLYHLAIRLPSMTDLADLLVQLSEYTIPVTGGEHDITTSVFVEDPEGNGLEFYVDHPIEDWAFEDGKVVLETKPINVPHLLTYVSDNKWQGIPDESMIGYINIKTINLKRVTTYYKNFFGLESSSIETNHALYLSSNGYHQHIVVNNWYSSIKRIENETTYGLACIDYHYPETTHKQLTGPDGILFRFNFYKVV